jgi:hypothetical protein
MLSVDPALLTVANQFKDQLLDTVAGILDSLWTGQMIAFILPVPTFFPKGAKYVRTG